ncbi:phenylalanine--tRNA ligase subunit beta [Lactobacillus sp. CC-MHH1034]|uniref:phenylalanine--tRNA ligase subunit beta n=1 Tax=Agrilactobacillus fermenti TaxID=2586909 RepID=UPI001E3A5A3A|nr:phenylalanine--tRNA ligase subunit beta [Agrilactobacillus fermenti]MCD2256690.1 phenylalanine--tRNA ligase subunit beta [Agrilactobacillus fermenti]
MKISYKWLQDYIPLSEDPDVLADKVSRTGIEVASVIRPETGLKKIVVGHINAMAPHPDSDHLNICQVDVGEAEDYQIVCGAPNVAPGQNVIVALPNSRIAGNTKIKKSKMRGVQSMGMICSLQEIGFSENVVPKEFANGIYVFQEPVTVGAPVFKYLGMDDIILDFDITPNRADTLGMHGAAWEVGAMYAEKPKFETNDLVETGQSIANELSVDVTNKNLVPAYYLRRIHNVKLQPSPMWLQTRLWNAGIRPINNVVDITNYVMITYGQPLHAFDANKLTSDHIVVRQAQKKETLETLDEVTRQLSTDDIVITDDSQTPIALAGIMGGKQSEIDGNTTDVILESAVFDGAAIRKTAQRQNLRTDASTRFEKGVDTSAIIEALNAAAALLVKYAAATVDQGYLTGQAIKPQAVTIPIKLDRINHILGTSLTLDQVIEIFHNLGFGTAVTDGELIKVTVPPRRWDIHIEADLVEEIARMYGYDRLPVSLPKVAMTPGEFNPQQKFIRHAKRQLQSAGLSEVISYALTTEVKATQFKMTQLDQLTKLNWPMTEDHAYLRLNLVSGLLNDIAYNVARKQTDLAIYEQGRVFPKPEQQVRPNEVEYLAGAITGLTQSPNWLEPKQAADFYTLKGIVTNYLATLALKDAVVYRATDRYSEMHPGRTADIYIGDQFVGFIGQVHPLIAKQYDIHETYVFQLDLTKLLEMPNQRIVSQPAPKYPAVSRDIALVVPENTTNAQIDAVIRRRGGQYLQRIKLFDVYQGKNIATGYKSMAYSLQFQNPEDTLTEGVINEQMTHILDYLKSELNAEIR